MLLVWNYLWSIRHYVHTVSERMTIIWNEVSSFKHRQLLNNIPPRGEWQDISRPWKADFSCNETYSLLNNDRWSNTRQWTRHSLFSDRAEGAGNHIAGEQRYGVKIIAMKMIAVTRSSPRPLASTPPDPYPPTRSFRPCNYKTMFIT